MAIDEDQTLESITFAVGVLTSRGDRLVGENTPGIAIHPFALWRILESLLEERDAYKQALEEIRDATMMGSDTVSHHVHGIASKALAATEEETE